jgi:WXG100 family type VII secretion target
VASPTSVRTEDLQRAHEDFVNALTASRGQLRAMQDNIGTLGTAWTGDAAGAFGRSLTTWCGQFENIVHELDGMRQKLEDVGQQYGRTHGVTVDLATNAATQGLPGL